MRGRVETTRLFSMRARASLNEIAMSRSSDTREVNDEVEGKLRYEGR